MGEIKGYISQVIGPVVDIHFDNGKEEKIKEIMMTIPKMKSKRKKASRCA